jgi:PRTRC genetic system protein A
MTESSQPKLDLKTFLARQNTGFLTDAAWPDISNVEKPVNYIVRRDGVWELRKSRAGIFVIQREKFANPLPGFPEEQNVEYGRSHFGKIPLALFKEILAFFKSICDESKDEAYVQTFWDPVEKRYFNHVPAQRVSGASVNFERDTELEARCHLVLETHSHNTMDAFFSGTDNADEKSDRFFGVIGKLNQSSPATLFSFVCGGKRVIIKREDIFEEEPEVAFPGDWKSRITKYPTAPVRTTSSSESTSLGNERAAMTHRSRPTQLDIETELEFAISDARRRMGGAAADHPFFQRSAASSDVDADDDELLIDLIKSTTARLSIGGVEMTRVQKQRLFDKLVDAMTDDDVADLIGSLLEAGHEETIVALLPEVADAAETDELPSDPFLNE